MKYGCLTVAFCGRKKSYGLRDTRISTQRLKPLTLKKM